VNRTNKKEERTNNRSGAQEQRLEEAKKHQEIKEKGEKKS